MKYICVECGYEFDEPKEFEERHNLDNPPYEKFLGCPQCRGEYALRFVCGHCGTVLTDVYYFIKMTGERLCKDCVTEYEFGDET